MYKYLLVLQGQGEGCDYTIGCNIRVEEIYGETFEKAFEEWYLDYNGVDDFDELNLTGNDFYSVKGYKIEEVPEKLDFQEFCNRHRTEEKLNVENDLEYQNYLKLKKKYESMDLGHNITLNENFTNNTTTVLGMLT